ncbi:MFS transporter [Neobacillus massiliamazoniensis]|uniref:Putative transporter n=1 Tax=Neobacillus massiliamazoniensis TaxID=1499688 RepID=A0A0U1NRP6_9BACI|nr:MFS transporter [Neobacillus massiliamazoniensis]CRK80721.1 putative transporter [Neobacillus massiliamazoniensis]
MKNKLSYLIGSMMSNFGDGIQQIAIMWYIYHLTGKALSIGFMIAIYYLPSILLTPFVSVYVDHHKSKNMVITTDIFRFLIVLGMSILLLLKIESTFLVYFLQFLLAVCYTIYKPAEQSFIKESFYDQEIPYVISKSSSLNEVALIVGSAVSGVFLIKLSLAASILINSLSFLVPAFLFMFIKSRNEKTVRQTKIHYVSELISGWNFINQRDGMKYLLFLSILNSISIQMTTTILLPLANDFKGGSALYSFFDISFAIGGIVAGFIIPFFLKKFKQQAIIFTMTGMAVSSILLRFNRSEMTAAILIFFLGLFTMSHLVLTQTFIQLNSPKEYIGRVVGLRTILASLVKISAALSTGILISMVGITNIFLLFSLVIIACFFTLKGLKKVKLPELIS